MKLTCPECGCRSWPVTKIISGSHVSDEYWSRIPERMGFYPNPSCEAMYFPKGLIHITQG